MTRDEEQLRLLSIFHYVVGGLASLFALAPVVHLVLGLAMVGGGIEGEDEMARVVGWFFVLFSVAFITAALTFAVLLMLAGGFLARRRHYTFCLVMAAVACTFMPFGTVLGVFTIIVLMRDSVKAAFPGAEGRQGADGSTSGLQP